MSQGPWQRNFQYTDSNSVIKYTQDHTLFDPSYQGLRRWAKERADNEAAALRLIKTSTRIPIAGVIDQGYDLEKGYYVETEKLTASMALILVKRVMFAIMDIVSLPSLPVAGARPAGLWPRRKRNCSSRRSCFLSLHDRRRRARLA
jgi:hypothetical protein